MADLRIADAPEIDESEVQGGLKIPTGGFGNKAINMTTVASWVVKDKDLPSKDYVDTAVAQGNQGLAGHVANKNNPHEVTKEQVGLGNVDNTADADKPISNATSAALNLKADKTQLQGLATTTQLDLKADKSTTYTKTEVDGTINDLYQSLEDNFVANGVALPYDPQVTYNDGAIVVDNGVLKKIEGGQLLPAVDAESISVGDSTLDVFARDYSSVFVISPETYTGDFKAALQDTLNKHSSVLIRGEHEIDLSNAVAVYPPDGSNITFEPSAKITVLPNNLERVYLFDMNGKSNINVWNPTCVGDKYTHLGTTGQWGHCFNVENCENVNIYYPNLSKFWGDGIYIKRAKNCKVFNPICDDNRRQGISLISCDGLEIFYPRLTNTSGQAPAFGMDIEPNWSGESTKGLKIYNAYFENNGAGGSYDTGFCISTHRTQYAEDGVNVLDTIIEVELYNPVFKGDALFLSSYVDTVKGFCRVYDPVFEESKRAALFFENHQSVNFFTEIHRPVFKNCVKTTSPTIYTNPITFECTINAIKTTGTRNIKIINPRFISEDGNYKDVAIRNITKDTFTDDMLNVEILDIESVGFLSNLSFGNGAIPNAPNSSFKVTYAKSDKSATVVATGSNISNILDRTNAVYQAATVTGTYYLNDSIPISDIEFTYRNESSNTASVLYLRFGTSTTATNVYLDGLSQNKISSGIAIPFGCFVKLKKTAANRWQVTQASQAVKTIEQFGIITVFDPPNIDAGETSTTTVTAQGAAVGDAVSATFNRYNAGISISAVVSAANTVLVTIKNNSDAAIDLTSGNLVVKLL